MIEEFEEITAEIILERINIWQRKPVFHQLTCGKDSKHALLEGSISNNKVVLHCPDCEYTQTYIPKLFLSNEFERLYAEQDHLYRLLSINESNSQ